jgi:hypothetical protein
MPLPRSRPLSPTERGDAMLNQDTVREATRLTRAGQLVEATALLQRMLHGDRAPGPTSRSDTQTPFARLGPPTIDVKANVVETRETRPTTQDSSAPPRRKRPAPFGGLGEFSGLGLRGPIGRAPPSASDIAPRAQNSSQAPSTTRRESGPTSCSSRAAPRENRFLWWSCFMAAPSRPRISRPAPG